MDQPLLIYIVEDDRVYRGMLERLLSMDPDHRVVVFASGREVLQSGLPPPEVMILDYSMPEMNGDEVLRRFRQDHPTVPVVLLSGQEDINVAVRLLKEGAYDYIVKDRNARERLLNALQHIKRERRLAAEVAESHSERAQLAEEVARLRQEAGKQHVDLSDTLLGESPAMQAVQARIQKSLTTTLSVLLQGETGTGKEVAARLIHYHSSRASGPFVPVNMASIPRELAESELFGHEKGAFTGAVSTRRGRFEQANGGTLFLDEIGELELTLQAKLLRVLQEREVVRVGGERPLALDVRIVAATHKDLRAEVVAGRFREDLYYRLVGLTIELPPLRERGQDVLLLARHFLTQFCTEHQLPPCELTPEARRRLLAHPFPGNVRELRVVVERAAALADQPQLDADDLELDLLTTPQDFFTPERTLEAYTVDIVAYYLQKYDQDVLRVAQILGIGKSTLYRLLQQHPELRR